MSEQHPSLQHLRSFNFTVIGANTRLKGEFEFRAHTSLAGHLSGKAINAEMTTFIIEKPGLFEGELSAGTIEIYGKFKGIVRASNKLVIHSSAEVEGELVCQDLCIYPGSLVNIKGEASGEDATL